MSTVPNISSPTSIRDPQTPLGLAPPVGLSSADAERRLAEFGRNEIRRERFKVEAGDRKREPTSEQKTYGSTREE